MALHTYPVYMPTNGNGRESISSYMSSKEFMINFSSIYGEIHKQH